MEDNHSFFLGKAGVASLSLAQLTPSLFIYLVQLEYQMDIPWLWILPGIRLCNIKMSLYRITFPIA